MGVDTLDLMVADLSDINEAQQDLPTPWRLMQGPTARHIYIYIYIGTRKRMNGPIDLLLRVCESELSRM